MLVGEQVRYRTVPEQVPIVDWLVETGICLHDTWMPSIFYLLENSIQAHPISNISIKSRHPTHGIAQSTPYIYTPRHAVGLYLLHLPRYLGIY